MALISRAWFIYLLTDKSKQGMTTRIESDFGFLKLQNPFDLGKNENGKPNFEISKNERPFDLEKIKNRFSNSKNIKISMVLAGKKLF